MKYGNNRSFYSSEVALGSQISALEKAGFIEWTGESTLVLIKVGDNLYKKVPAKEWRFIVSKEMLDILVQYCNLTIELTWHKIME